MTNEELTTALSARGFHRGVIALMVTTCLCGRRKLRKSSFCAGCYYALPVGRRNTLYKRSGHGYEEAYEAAVAYLAKAGKVKSEVPLCSTET